MAINPNESLAQDKSSSGSSSANTDSAYTVGNWSISVSIGGPYSSSVSVSSGKTVFSYDYMKKMSALDDTYYYWISVNGTNNSNGAKIYTKYKIRGSMINSSGTEVTLSASDLYVSGADSSFASSFKASKWTVKFQTLSGDSFISSQEKVPGNNYIKAVLKCWTFSYQISNGIMTLTNGTFVGGVIPYWVDYPDLASISAYGTKNYYVSQTLSLSDFSCYACYQNTSKDYSSTERLYPSNPYLSIGIDDGYTFAASDSPEKKVAVTYTYYKPLIDGTTEKQVKSTEASVCVIRCTSIKLMNFKSSFAYGDSFSYGDSASVMFYYSDNTSASRAVSACSLTSSDSPVGQNLTKSGEYNVSVVDNSTGAKMFQKVTYAVSSPTEDSYDSIRFVGEISGTREYNTQMHLSDIEAAGIYIQKHNKVTDSWENLSDSEKSAVTYKGLDQNMTNLVDNWIVTAEWGGNEAYLYVTINFLKSISATPKSKEYFSGRALDLSDVKVTATYGHTGDSSYSSSAEVTGWTSSIANGTVMTAAATERITYSESGIDKSDDISITVKQKSILSISISSNPSKLSYYKDYDGMDYSGLSVTASYDDGTSEDVTSLASGDKPASQTFSALGQVQIEISYMGKTASFMVTVIEDSIKSISVDASKATQSFEVGEKFSYEGADLTISFNSENHPSICWSNISDKRQQLSGEISTDSLSVLLENSIDAGYEFAREDIGTKTVYVKYSSFQATYTISVVRPTSPYLVNKTNVDLFPTEYLNGDKPDFSLISMNMSYKSGYSEKLTYADTEEAFVAGTFMVDASSLILNSGAITVTEYGTKSISIKGKDPFNGNLVTSTMKITVSPNYQLSSLSFSDSPSIKKTYLSGDTWLGEGIKLTAVFKDASNPTAVFSNDDIDVSNSGVTTNPGLGSILYEPGQKEIDIFYTSGSTTKSTSITITVQPSYAPTDAVAETLRVVKTMPKDMPQIEEVSDFSSAANKDGYIWALYDVNDTNAPYSGGNNTASRTAKNGTKPLGYVLQGTESEGITVTPATVVLFSDYTAPVYGESNITVTFPRYVEGYAEMINGCHFGTLFGTSNVKNRLFVSGNAEKCNRDWHTGDTGTTGDFTYFPDDSWCDYGQTGNDVVGYDIVSTDQMIVLKSKSRVEPTNYFRSSGLATAIDAAGATKTDLSGNTLYQESFKTYTGNIGIGALSSSGICNFNGDTLYIGENKSVCGLDIEGQVGDSQRISSSRSKYIDNDLKKYTEEQLSDSRLWSDGEYLYLALSDCMYIAHSSMFSTTTRQYEWWKTSVGGAESMVSIDGEVFFGNGNGSLFKLGNGGYSDCEKIFVGTGGTFIAKIDDASDVIYNSEMNKLLDESGDYYFEAIPKNSGNAQERIYYSVGTVGKKGEKCDFIVNAAENCLELVCYQNAKGDIDFLRQTLIMSRLNDGDTVYFSDNADITARKVSVSFDCANLVEPKAKMAIKLSAMSSQELANAIGHKMCKVLSGLWSVCGINKEKCSFNLCFSKETESLEKVDIILLGSDKTQTFRSELHRHKPVQSYYITAPFIAGSLSYRKTLWSWTLTDGTGLGSSMDVGIATNQKALDDLVTFFTISKGAKDGYDLTDVDYNFIDYDKVVLPRTATYIRPVSAQLICFAFRSKEAVASTLSSLSVLYTIPGQGYGIK